MLTPAWTKHKPHAVQSALWRCSKRFVCVPAGRGSGKTELAKRRLVRYLPVMKPWPDPRYFYGAPTTEQAKRIAWQHLVNLTPKAWIKSAVNLTITTVFGSELSVVGMDRPQRIEGPQWDGCVLDESCDLQPGTFDTTVVPMLTHRDGWCWRIGVPKRQGPSSKEFREDYESWVAGEIPDATGFTWPSSDILSPEKLAFAAAKLDIKDYLEQFDAVWQDVGGGVFHSFDPAYNVRPCTYDTRLPIIVGSDFNVDPMCWVIGHRWNDRIEWFDEIFERNTNTPQTLGLLYERYSDHTGGFEFYGDATGRARRSSAVQSDYDHIMSDARFRKLGRTTHYRMDNPEREDRFAACNAMLCSALGHRRMFVDPRCVRLIADLKSRYYKPGTRETADKGDLGHMTDAMGYSVHVLFPIRVEIEYEKPQRIEILEAR